ncbi:hypothetical protein SSX86_006707 [Deinandra increscens subsp. villosa]|uniref:TIR domain-containing protein n=1 Tax=Deinandra increscens subsp. villosa TaxID=3103831 RepID=A0AAP0DFB9_9ASTR
MASTSTLIYDVFLSFRGEDTRNSFTDHLYKALHEAGIRTFRDSEEIREGQELKPEIERSITESKASIIVFSENFANSRWCLDELWLILEQKRKRGNFVLPLFYGVDPSDVKNQRGSFRIEAKNKVKGSKWTPMKVNCWNQRGSLVIEDSKWTEDNVQRWKAALTEAANLKGMVVSGLITLYSSMIPSLQFTTSLPISMASTSTLIYDVFLSFRGEDTRNSFTDHLYKALHEAGIRTFRDAEEIREGQELKPEIERSITESKASIIVFSENFANSRWCLDELWLILEQKRKRGNFVLPLFYGVDPSDVKNQRGSFRIEAKNKVKGSKWKLLKVNCWNQRGSLVIEDSKWTEDNVQRWKAALTEAANLKGMVVSG